LLIVTGTMGAGKSGVLAEASDILSLRHMIHAAIDLDALGLACLAATASNDSVMYSNLKSVCKNYAAAGVKRVMLARALEDRAEFEFCRTAVAATNTVVCRLAASVKTTQERVTMRESGLLQRKYVARVPKLDTIIDHAKLEDFIVVNENRAVSEVANEVLVKAGWISIDA
jgi:hypothetical protein